LEHSERFHEAHEPFLFFCTAVYSAAQACHKVFSSTYLFINPTALTLRFAPLCCLGFVV
jgi:hypothetical protein